MARRFTNLQFGPMHLRPLLRRRMERGEHLIAWGVAVGQNDGSSLHIAAYLLPGIGPAIAAAAASSNKRLVIVTSRRLVVVLNKHPRKVKRDLAVCFEAAHEYLTVTRRSRRNSRFQLAAPGFNPPLKIALENHRSARAKRLAEALSALTNDPAKDAASRAGRP